jgi:hypothetical protein
MMTEETEKLLEEAFEEVADLVEYVHSESGDPTLHQWVLSVEDKLKKVLDNMPAVKRQPA